MNPVHLTIGAVVLLAVAAYALYNKRRRDRNKGGR